MGITRTGNMFAGKYQYTDKTQKLTAKRNEFRERLQEAQDTDENTKSDIVVKPDGSRVLVITTNVGGMETTTCLEISKPTAIQNESGNGENISDVEQITEQNMEVDVQES